MALLVPTTHVIPNSLATIAECVVSPPILATIAFTFLINGIIQMVAGNESQKTSKLEWSWGSFFLGLFYVIFALLLLFAPVLVSTASVVLAAGFLAIVGGIITVIFSFKLKGA